MPTDKTEDDLVIYLKGSELDTLAKNLIELAFDDNENTRVTMQRSIVCLGDQEPKLLLSLILSFLKKSIKNKKIPIGHRVILLNSMKEILKSKDFELKELTDFVSNIIKQVFEEMTSSKDIQPDWQSAASEILVTMSTNYCRPIIKFLIEKIKPNVLPHFFIIQTLGAMAVNNPYEMVPYLSSIITQFLTMLSLAKADNYRWVIASSMAQFCEAILEYVANPDRAPDNNVSITTFSNYIFSAFEIFFGNWLNTRESKLRKAVLDAIGTMVFIIDRSNFEAQLSKVMSGIIAQYKKHTEAYHVTKSLSQVLQAATGTYSSSGSHSPSNDDSPTVSERPLIIECQSLIVEMDTVINVLFNQLQQSLDICSTTGLTAVQHINAVRNQNEVKRCFTTLCMSSPTTIVTSCLHRLEGPEKNKITSLIILRHVISSCDKQLHDKHSQLIAGLRNLIGDNAGSNGNISSTVVCTNMVKMNLAQVIISMGSKNYLSEPGGSNMIEFIVRHCCEPKSEIKNKRLKITSPDSNSQPIASYSELKGLCESILILSSSTVKPMRTVLWPYLMQLIVPVEYTEAVGTICCTIHNLFAAEISASRTGDESNGQLNSSDDSEDNMDSIIDYDVQVNIPAPQFLLARLIVLTGVPRPDNCRGAHILKAMQVLIYNFHENLPPIWNLVIPKLISYLEKTLNSEGDNADDSNQNEFDKNQWEDLLLMLIAKSIDRINDEEWTAEFGEALGQQICLYDKLPEERGFLFKCLGSLMSKSSKQSFIEKHLDLIFHSTRQSDNEERMGFASGFGLCAASHLDTVLSKLELYLKTDLKRATGLFSFIKEKTEGSEKEVIRASIMVAYGTAVFYGPRELVPSRLESYVVKALQPYLKPNKDQLVNRLILECIDLIARALNVDKLCQHYRFEMRNDLIFSLLSYIEMEPSTAVHSDIRSLAVRTIGNLIVLHPPVTNIEMQQVLNTCINNVFNLPPDGILTKKSKDMPFDEAQALIILMNKTMDSLYSLCQIILKTFFSNVTFNEMYKVIQYRLTSDEDHIRERALTTLNLMLTCYYKELVDVNNNGTQLSCMGSLFGDITPRLADPDINNRLIALDCVVMTMKIQMKLDIGRDPDTDQLISSLSNNKDKLKKFDSNILFASINDIANVICKKITQSMIDDLLTSLYTGLKDSQKNGATAASVLLNVLFQSRFVDLQDKIPTILTTIHDIIHSLADNTRTGVLRAIKLLSSNYVIETLNATMVQSLPLDDGWKEILTNCFNEEMLLNKCLVHLTELMIRTMPFEEREDPSHRKVNGLATKMVRYPCHTWLAAMNCLQILCSNTIECGHVCLTRMYSKLFTSILVACASSVICLPFTGKSHEKKSGLEANLAVGVFPIRICCEGFRNFLTTTQSHEIIEAMTVLSGWEKMEKEEEFMEFVSLISKSICENKSSEVVFIISNLGQYANSTYEQHRILVTGFYGSIFSSVIKIKNLQVLAEPNFNNSESLIDSIIAVLLNKLGDKSVEVRRLSLVGIGNVGRCNDTIVQKHATSLMSNLLIGMDDRHDSDDKLINSAMNGLASLMAKLTEIDVRDVLVTICLRMLSCYERDSSNVRASAFRLFGSLAKLATGPSLIRYISEIDSVMVPLFVHLEDPNTDVVRACKYTLKQVMPIYCTTNNDDDSQRKTLNDLVQNCLKEDSILHYGEFCNELSKALVSQMPLKVNDIIMRFLVYFKSEYPELTASAVLMIGNLMHDLDEEVRSNLQIGQICSELIQLLRSKHAIVRTRAAEAISLLHKY